MGIKKWLKWEFWPFWFFYLPVSVYWFWLSLKARSFVFFSAANPLMEMGGFSTYSKYNVLKNLPQEFVPTTLFVEAQTDFYQLLKEIEQAHISFPLIVKPDRGERGFGVEKIDNPEQLESHYQKYQHLDLVVQALVDEPLEFGVMYYRLPNEAKGNVNSMVQKEFLQATGDGKSTLKELLRQNKRTNYHYDMLAHLYEPELDTILPNGKIKNLVSIGNHARGTTFLNANHLINPQLINVFDAISQQVKGYYFGRYDIRVTNLEDLYAGKNIMILELNGANSEPAHIYDPNMSLIAAYKHLFKHWKILYRISVQNHKKGTPYMPLVEAIRTIRAGFKKRKG